MNSNEIASYAADPRALPILWSLLPIAAIAVVALSIACIRLSRKMRAQRGREAALSRSVAEQAQRIAGLEARIVEYIDMEEGVEEIKAEVRRADAIRTKAEERLRVQNAEIEQVRAEARDRMAEVERLRKIVEHVDGLW